MLRLGIDAKNENLYAFAKWWEYFDISFRTFDSNSLALHGTGMLTNAHGVLVRAMFFIQLKFYPQSKRFILTHNRVIVN